SGRPAVLGQLPPRGQIERRACQAAGSGNKLAVRCTARHGWIWRSGNQAGISMPGPAGSRIAAGSSGGVSVHLEVTDGGGGVGGGVESGGGCGGREEGGGDRDSQCVGTSVGAVRSRWSSRGGCTAPWSSGRPRWT